MCDESKYTASYVFLIEDYADEKIYKLKSSAPVAFVWKKFTRGQTPLALYAKKFFLAFHLASDEFRRISCGTEKLIIVMTDNKALTRFLSG